MEKILDIGTISTGEKKRGEVFCKIQYEKGKNENEKLSISGVVAPTKNGNAYTCGQIDDTIREALKSKDIKLAKGWTESILKTFLKIWKEWHLNDMKAGCSHQRLMGWEKEGYKKHPAEPCPICGYKYGTAWLREDIPQAVLDFLVFLPESKRKPAWV